MMAAEDGTVHHEDWEWDSQRDNFTEYYKTENKTLKESARCMHERHGFFATPRQWERRVKAWGLEKYTSRQDRLRQLEGRSIHEVARAGRRQRAYEPSLLHPEQHPDDRNIRRFARRELSRSGSRSRSRSRSNSFGQRSRSASPMPEGDAFEEVIQEDVYGIDFSPLLESGSIHNTTNPSTIQLQPMPTSQDSFSAQAHVMQLHNNATDETSGEVFLSFPESVPMQNTMQETDVLDQSQYNYADLDRRYSLEAMPPLQPDDPPSQFPLLDTSFDGGTGFMATQNETMQDVSPTFHGPAGSWLAQSTSNHNPSGPQTFLPGTSSNPQSFNVRQTNDTEPAQDYQSGMQAMNTPILAVPELVFPSSPSPSHLETPSLISPAMYNNQAAQEISQSDQRIYADFYASVGRYSHAVIEAVKSSTASLDNRVDVLHRLANDVNLESKYRLLSKHWQL